MEQWEKEQERIIKQQHDLLNSGYVPLSKEQQRQNMQRNWVELFDENGKPYYIPKQYFYDQVNQKPKQNPIKAIFTFLWHVIEIVVIGCMFLLFVSAAVLLLLQNISML